MVEPFLLLHNRLILSLVTRQDLAATRKPACRQLDSAANQQPAYSTFRYSTKPGDDSPFSLAATFKI